MQGLFKDSVFFYNNSASDSNFIKKSVLLEAKSSAVDPPPENLYSDTRNNESIPDWFFLVNLIILAVLASARIYFGKFVRSLWINAYSYQIASKAYRERGIIQKRIELGLDFIYLVNFSLFIYLISKYYSLTDNEIQEFRFLISVFFILCLLVLIRIFLMRLIAFIFQRSDIFKGFLYHYFIYIKILGLILVPFLLSIPYTSGILQKVLIFTGISAVIIIQAARLIRAAVYVIKNVVLFFYLILYLCILEILPLMVVIKLLLSLAKG